MPSPQWICESPSKDCLKAIDKKPQTTEAPPCAAHAFPSPHACNVIKPPAERYRTKFILKKKPAKLIMHIKIPIVSSTEPMPQIPWKPDICLAAGTENTQLPAPRLTRATCMLRPAPEVLPPVDLPHLGVVPSKLRRVLVMANRANPQRRTRVAKGCTHIHSQWSFLCRCRAALLSTVSFLIVLCLDSLVRNAE